MATPTVQTSPAQHRGIALVTGGGSGIGRALALHLGAQGHYIAVADLDEAAARSVAGSIEASGGRASFHPIDVADAASVGLVVDSLPGTVELLVNSAGIQHVAPIEEFGADRFRRMIDIMLSGSAIVSAAVLPGMRARGRGRIVHIGSIHSLVASPYKSAYVAAKHGLVGLTRALALETADCDITVNMVCPAYVLTPLVEGQIEAQARAHGLTRERVVQEIMLRPMPKKRFIEMDEIAGAVDFLASHAARNVTGQCLVIDGGWTAH
jgi:3-hydroxybutyrate dehydrogenase